MNLKLAIEARQYCPLLALQLSDIHEIYMHQDTGKTATGTHTPHTPTHTTATSTTKNLIFHNWLNLNQNHT